MKSLVPWPFRQTGRLKICAYCGLRASAFGFPWPAAQAVYIALELHNIGFKPLFGFQSRN
ncbi:MAG: hypothetical protein GY821_17775 [Gammaproteobacteria bacterium]|nr:hypothetical protein [Gammaproteobacteria bacterium]